MNLDNFNTIKIYEVKTSAGNKKTKKYFNNIGMAIAYAKGWLEETYKEFEASFRFEGFTTEKDKIVLHYYIQWTKNVQESRIHDKAITIIDVVDAN